MAEQAKPAQAQRAAPAAKQDDAKAREQAEMGALRARIAQLEEAAKRERRTSDPTSEDYSPELAQEEAWPGNVRVKA